MQSASTLTDQLLELFATELQGVHFPEVDATSLTAHRDAVEAATRAVEQAETALAQASSQLAERKQALALHGKRALAYAKVYADERPGLRERIESLGALRGKSGSLSLGLIDAEPKRRGRPRKSEELAPEAAAE